MSSRCLAYRIEKIGCEVLHIFSNFGEFSILKGRFNCVLVVM